MFLFQYVMVIVYFTVIYKISRSTRSFNNWMFDYILCMEKYSGIKACGIQWLLLFFEDSGDEESLAVCLKSFKDDIAESPRLRKISARINRKESRK